MKFHHLARHTSQFTNGNNYNNNSNNNNSNNINVEEEEEEEVAAAIANNEINFMPLMSSKRTTGNLFKQQQQLQLCQKQLDLNSEDEEEELERNQTMGPNYFGQQHEQQAQMEAQLDQALDSTGFLMDKNKKLFPQKLWELIHNPSIQHCLRWSPDGQRVYLNRNEFEAYYLKTPNNQFHTQKAISFVRQMNMYGFRKVDDCYYENDNFRRDKQHLLRNMIRRHPNKGLFAGLDHHQLAAAAAAQQALQVNKQLQQLEQQHKERTEQALRLNSYLNNHHHQFHQQSPVMAAAAAAAAASHQLRNHSSPFERMSTQLLGQVAASHLSQQQSQLQSQQIQQQQQQQLADGRQASNNNTCGSSGSNGARKLNSSQYQPIKSRLLSNFYAAAAAAAAAQNPADTSQVQGEHAHLLSHNQDSMHSNSSLDTQPSQCSSVVHSGSAGSPPVMPQQRRTGNIGSARLQLDMEASAAAQEAAAGQQVATDLSSQSLANRQALHESLVRSLLQLKQQQQQPRDLLASLQHQQGSRSLLESLASLGSGGTGSIVDPASSSPTELTASPPSNSPSPAEYTPNGPVDLVLDLAKSSPKPLSLIRRLLKAEQKVELNSDDESLDGKQLGAVNDDEAELEDNEQFAEPIDVARKVRRFLADHRAGEAGKRDVTFEPTDSESGERRKRIKIEVDGEEMEHTDNNSRRLSSSASSHASLGSLSRALVIEMCERRKDQLDELALDEAAQYTERFLDKLLENAALISRHPSSAKITHGDGTTEGHFEDSDIIGKQEPVDDEGVEVDNGRNRGTTGGNLISASSLSLAFKLIPAKLLCTIQQQVSVKPQLTTSATSNSIPSPSLSPTHTPTPSPSITSANDNIIADK